MTVLQPALIALRGREVVLAQRCVLYAKEASTADPNPTSASRAMPASSVVKGRQSVQHPAQSALLLELGQQRAKAACLELTQKVVHRRARFVLLVRLATREPARAVSAK